MPINVSLCSTGHGYGTIEAAAHEHEHDDDDNDGEEKEEKEENEEEEPKVTTLELFSDLVIVVSIHVVAEPLEESCEDYSAYTLYLIRVFFLWFVWHMATLFMNTAVKLGMQNCPIHNSIMFFWMACILQMTQAFASDDDVKAIQWYLGLRCFEVMVFARQIFAPHRSIRFPEQSHAHKKKSRGVSQEWLDHMQAFIPVLCVSLAVCEILPLSVAAAWRDEEGHVYMPAAIASVVLILLWFIAGTTYTKATHGKLMSSAFDPEHLQERYELITLIFTGELCFAAGRQGNEVASTAVLFMAFATYLLTFKVHPPIGHVKFWARGVLHTIVGLFLYAGVFCAIPSMGSAFVRIVEVGQDDDRDEKEEDDDVEPIISSGDLLCYSAGAFMVFSALINLIHADPVGPDAPKISSVGRGMIRIGLGLLMMAMAGIVPETITVDGTVPLSTILIPFLALLAAAIEIVATGSLKIVIVRDAEVE